MMTAMMKSRRIFELEINGRKVRLGVRTLIMGVLNVTPDSFSDGGRYLDPERAIRHGLELVREGADWIDVGGESTRPGARPVRAEEELRRVVPVIRALARKLRNIPISIDTSKAVVAEEAVRAGAAIINDVSGLRFDLRLAEVARRHRTPLILMHIRGRPANMQQNPFAQSIWRSVLQGLARSIQRALALGLRRSQLIIDPGFGFGKTRRQNFELLAYLDRLERLDLPILVGTSRKSFVQAIVAGEDLEPATRKRPRVANDWALTQKGGAGFAPSSGPSVRPWQRATLPDLQAGDVATVAASILKGAHIVRVHDVATVLPAVRIADAILKANKS